MQYTPLTVADIAICKCYDNKPHEDEAKMQKRILNVANVHKHSSTIEHLVYSFDIDGISRAVLQELARHRIASYTVKSTRYTLKELRDEEEIVVPYYDSSVDAEAKEICKKYLVLTGNEEVDLSNMKALSHLQFLLCETKITNDIAKYMLPEAYKTSLVMTVNARTLQNFLSLRTDSHALWEIQDLAREMYQVLPENHKFIFKEYVKGE